MKDGQWAAEREAAKQRSREAHGRAKAKGPRREMKPGKLHAHAAITWLDPPVPLCPPQNMTPVVGVCSDAADDVKRMYGVRV